MPRYYFHVRRGQLTILDPQGIDLPNFEEAVGRGRRIALREALNSAHAKAGRVIVDDEWQTILELPFEDILPLQDK